MFQADCFGSETGADILLHIDFWIILANYFTMQIRKESFFIVDSYCSFALALL